MRNFFKWLVPLSCLLGLLLSANIASANNIQKNAPTPAIDKHQTLAYNGWGGCRWVGGYWRNGYWHSPRKVCGYHGGYRGYYRGNCRWVGGYWRYGYWHPSRRVCW